MIAGAIFDVDGTLIDSMSMWNQCGERYLASLGIKAEEGLAEQMKLLPIQESGAYLKEHYSLSLSPEEITKGLNKIGYDFYMEEATLKPYIGELLSTFAKSGIPMTVATASNAEIVSSVLTRLGIRPYFQDIYSCEILGFSKNQPQCFRKCLSLLGTDPADTWVFEDMLHAARSAHAAGLKVGGIFDAASAEDEPEMRRLCDYYFKSEQDYKNFIKNS